eukprot:SAG31_NODE_1542_length_7951_cov_4.038844_3_plen_189_part_00
MTCKGCYFLDFVQLFEKHGTLIERCTALIEKVSSFRGYGDLGFTGHPTTHTPNIDQLAYSGKILNSWYSGCPVCSGSRTALMTGRQFTRVGANIVEPRRMPLLVVLALPCQSAQAQHQRWDQIHGSDTCCRGSNLPLAGVPGVFGDSSTTGLPLNETTVADQLKVRRPGLQFWAPASVLFLILLVSLF